MITESSEFFKDPSIVSFLRILTKHLIKLAESFLKFLVLGPSGQERSEKIIKFVNRILQNVVKVFEAAILGFYLFSHGQVLGLDEEVSVDIV